MRGQVCLTYLMSPELADFNGRAHVLRNLNHYPLLRHAVKYWPPYVNNGESKGHYMDERTKSSVQTFLSTSKMPNGGNLTFWVGLLMPDAPPQDVVNTKPL